MKPERLFLLAAAATALAGCLKEAPSETNYVLKPLVQPMSVDPTEPLEGVQAFAFPVDTLEWGIASYDDALAGILTSKSDPAQRLTEPSAVAVPYDAVEGAAGWLQMPLNDPLQTIVAVDTRHRIYGYTTQKEIIPGLPELYVAVVFKPWKEGFSYKEGNWSFYNDFYTPPVELDTYVAPRVQTEEGGPETPASSAQQFKVYANAADTTQWYIASYDDAVAGRITRKENPDDTRTTPSFQAYYQDPGLYGMTVSSTPLMVVAVDRTNRLYAYSKQEVDLQGEPQTWPVPFRTWTERWIYVEEGWRIVDEAFRPEESEIPENPADNR